MPKKKPVGLEILEELITLRQAKEELLAACKAVRDGFRYERGKPVMSEWLMKQVLATAIEKWETP